MTLRAVWKSALVVPARVRVGERARDPVVLAQEERVEQREADLGVRRVAPAREQRVDPVGRDLVGTDDLDLAELRLLDAAVVEVRRELGAADRLGLQPPALVGAQLLGPRRCHPVERQQVDLVARVVAARVALGVAVRAQEPVGEPLREVGEEHRGLRAGRAVAGAGEEVRHPLGVRQVPGRHRGKVAVRVRAIGQRRPGRVVRQRAQRVRPRGHRQHGRVDQRVVGEAAQPRTRVQELPHRFGVRQNGELELVLEAVALAAAGHFLSTLKEIVFAAPLLPAASNGVTTAR